MTERLVGALENLIFRHRAAVLTLLVLFTLAMGFFAARTHVDASFLKQLPVGHPFVRTFVQYADQFGGANRIVIALVARDGDIFTPRYFETLRQVTDEVFFIPGVDRPSVTSLFTPNVRFIEVVEDGFRGGNVIPADFEPTEEGLQRVRENIPKSERAVQLVAPDFSGSMVSAQLLEIDPGTGKRLDYLEVAKALETRIRHQFDSPEFGIHEGIHIIGFAKVVGDITDGARNVLVFFGVSLLLTAILVAAYTHSVRLAVWPVLCSLTAVVWQMGLLNVLGFGIDPMSILVPFLVFAIGVSHGVQMVRNFRNEVFGGASSLHAARSSFRTLLVPGGVALLTDTVGFVTMLLIEIEIIRELAITASLGVGLIVLTNLVMLPVLLSWMRLPDSFRQRVARRREQTDRAWRVLARVVRPVPATAVLVVTGALGVFGVIKSRQVQIGDLDAGVPELRESSRYNRDAAVITSRFSIGVDLLSVIAETVPDGCIDYEVMRYIDDFGWHVRNVAGVQSVISLASLAPMLNSGWNEGHPKWRILPQDSTLLAQAVSPVETSSGLLNSDGSVMPVMIFLEDHKADTIDRVVAAVQQFKAAHPSDQVRLRLASGNVGVMAATNEVVRAAQFPIVAWVYGAVVVLCLITFRSVRATVCIVLPLVVVSYLAYALMVYLGIGLKPATLPVVALGVGIGVDYGIYLFSRLKRLLESGLLLEAAMFQTLRQTGSAVVFTGLTLGLGVSTWIFSELKFQADMGVLLTFMFLVNMLGAIFVLPALAHWLLPANR
jgi:predicted RND superfamily exporter protein